MNLLKYIKKKKTTTSIDGFKKFISIDELCK